MFLFQICEALLKKVVEHGGQAPSPNSRRKFPEFARDYRHPSVRRVRWAIHKGNYVAEGAGTNN